MKRRYTALGLLTLSSLCPLAAQNGHAREHRMTRSFDRNAALPSVVHHAAPAQDPDRVTIWEDDLSSASNWTIGHYGSEDLDWQIGVGLTGTGGASIDPIASPTAANGYAMLDSDGHNNQGTVYESSCLTTAQPIDLSGYPAVQLQFYTQYRKWTDEECYVEVSTNNTDWATNLDPTSDLSLYPRVFKVFPGMATQAPFENPTLKTINITAVAGSQSQVWVRFHWTGIYGYMWFIDDVSLSTPPDNNLTLLDNWLVEEPGNYEDATVRNLEYTRLPVEQASPITARAVVLNNGGVTQNDLVLTATINGMDYYSDPLPSLAAGTADTLIVQTNWTPSAPGEVTVELSVASSDPTDFDPADNERTRTMLFTGPDDADGNSVMALDTNALDGWYRITGSAANDAIGVRFQIDNPGSTAYGAGLVFYEETTDNTLVNIYLRDDSGDDLAFVEYFQILPEYESGSGEANVINVPFETPVDLDPAVDYELWVENTTSDSVSIGISGTLNPGGLVGHVPGAGQNTIYIAYGNGAPMMRLYLATASFVGMDEEALAPSLMWNQLAPNPAGEGTRLGFTLKEGAMVSWQVTDALGRVVDQRTLGTLGAGTHDVLIGTADLDAGLYHVQLQAGQQRLTRGLTVSH